jgi:hypothetical protein
LRRRTLGDLGEVLILRNFADVFFFFTTLVV